jgi:formylglycine-generating enzyme required for sulfatase activity
MTASAFVPQPKPSNFPMTASAFVPQPGQAQSVNLGNATILTLLWVPPKPGDGFMMGSPTSEEGRDNDETQHLVVFTKGFWLGKTEVTQAQWQELMGNNPSNFKGAELPVEEVSWDDAMAFCRKLTKRERVAGRLPEEYEYTLPTEAQWEYVCRAGSTGAYASDLDVIAWYWSNSEGTTHPVGTKQSNAWGFYDMQGNVWEWCADWYGDYPNGSVTDPTGPSSGSLRVVRGGGWGLVAGGCRCADRGGNGPGGRNGVLGFRLALSLVRSVVMSSKQGQTQ